MSQFEFFMTFYGLLLGLGMAELLLGFANIVRARVRPKLGGLTPALGVFMFVQMLASFNDAWIRLQGVRINFDQMALPTLIGVAYFFAAVTVVPRDLDDWHDLDEYFLARRRWTVGLLLGVFLLGVVLDVIDEAAFWRAEPFSAGRLTYLAVNLTAFVLFLAMLVARPRVALTAVVSLTALVIALYTDTWLGHALSPSDRRAARVAEVAQVAKP